MGKILETIVAALALSIAGCPDSTERNLNGYKIITVNSGNEETTRIESDKREKNGLPETYISLVTVDGKVVRVNMQLSNPEQIERYTKTGEIKTDYKTGDAR